MVITCKLGREKKASLSSPDLMAPSIPLLGSFSVANCQDHTTLLCRSLCAIVSYRIARTCKLGREKKACLSSPDLMPPSIALLGSFSAANCLGHTTLLCRSLCASVVVPYRSECYLYRTERHLQISKLLPHMLLNDGSRPPTANHNVRLAVRWGNQARALPRESPRLRRPLFKEPRLLDVTDRCGRS